MLYFNGTHRGVGVALAPCQATRIRDQASVVQGHQAHAVDAPLSPDLLVTLIWSGPLAVMMAVAQVLKAPALIRDQRISFELNLPVDRAFQVLLKIVTAGGG